MNFAIWISQHGSLPIPQNAAAFGNAPGITFASAAFYQVGNSIVPQFMAGLPMLLSLGFWAGGARLARALGAGARRARRLHVRRPGGQARRAPVGAVRRAGDRDRHPRGSTSAATPTARRSRRSCSSARCRCGSTPSAPTGARRTPGGGGPAGGRTRGPPRTCSPGSPGCCSASRCSCGMDGPGDILFVVPYCGLLVLRRQRQVIAARRRHGHRPAVRRGGRVVPHPAVPDATNSSSVKPMVAAFVLVTVVTVGGRLVAAPAWLGAAQPRRSRGWSRR